MHCGTSKLADPAQLTVSKFKINMVKTKKSQRMNNVQTLSNGKKLKRRSRTTRGGGGSVSSDISAEFHGHMRMVMDPCAAPATCSVYSGASGVVTRHVRTGQLSGAVGDQALSFAWGPSIYRVCEANTANGGTVYAPGYTAIGVPGYDFLNSVTAQSRVIGACLRIHWNGTELSRAGSVAYGCMQLSQYPGGVNTTVDNLFQMLPNKTRVVPGELEIRWNPVNEDESYEQCDSSVTVTNNQDRNGLFFAYQGPAGAAFGYTLTVLYEWVPALGQGQPSPPTVRKSLPAAVSHINSALSRIKHWGDGAHDLASQLATATTAVYNSANTTYKVVKGAAKVIGEIGVPMLPLLL